MKSRDAASLGYHNWSMQEMVLSADKSAPIVLPG
jgi:hypothetical protein